MGHHTRHHLLASFLCIVLLSKNARCDGPHIDSASLPLEHRSVYGPPLQQQSPAPIYGAPPQGSLLGSGANNEISSDEAWPLAATNDSPQIKHLQVQCEKTHMRVNIEFDRPFYGMIFSKGFYSDSHCVHLKPGTGHLSATFEIFLNSCGMSSSANHNAAGFGSPTPSGSYVENTIIIQYDPYVQEVWDQARKLRCTWYDFYEKAVTFRPFQVDMLHAVTANFLGDNLQCWMQIQVGKGPWASEVSGIVKIGQTMTMVLAIKDDENKFDMLVRNCVAHDGKRAPIQLVDQSGCVVRPKIMSKFQKIKNFGPSASVVSFAYFQAFKFPDSMNVHFQCVIQVCRYNCPEPKCGHGPSIGGGEYGVPQIGPNALSAEYGAPDGYERGDFGLGGLPPAAYPDPRHPADATGAYSENQPDVVPSPQAQTSAVTTSESNLVSSPSPQGSNELHLPPPPLPGQSGYSTMKRKDDMEGGNLVSLGGRPRSVEGLDDLRGVRRRRETDSDSMELVVKPRIYKRDTQEMTDVNTSRTIQVVAPGDVNFALNSNSNNETVVIQSARSADAETICMSVPSFVGGLVMLLLVLAVASLVAAFLFVRVRHFDRKGLGMAYVN
ncbi:cuticlin-4 [Eupeodes corollae]|uniref:cuticlin-4 n=1 Tax=Eupeodes corollae TaxID=290404 RepID=UPI002491B389|nr:cuticlin-4 [Eupeodes corollae]XP_055914913.1 cuticlin-4 [Eupeodes corollae]XP_055914915.1 cuticlin-4 [Eupeodes corollae]